MSILEENVKLTIQKIDSLHDSINLKNWGELKREGFVFELENSTKKLKEIFDLMKQTNKETMMLLEKNTPKIDEFLEVLEKNIIILESNIKMERTKRIRVELINETEQVDVPELYRALQQNVLDLCLKSRYEIEKLNKFLIARKTPFIKKGNTAKALLEILQKREEEIDTIKKKNLELKRNSFFKADEVTIIELEEELNNKEKQLEMNVKETRNALKTHLAQINYVEGSFSNLEKKISLIENNHENFVKKTMDLVRGLKKERDYARKIVLELEEETIKIRQDQTQQIMTMNEQRDSLKENIRNKYINEIKKLKKENENKQSGLDNLQRLVEMQENEIRRLKKALENKI
jgi:hypothetical protein